ncbi:MAG: PIN domain-containing protein, partial [Nitrososphaera sp.]|nr:PIN domain-containing protein [Nitrososphaera sp.]
MDVILDSNAYLTDIRMESIKFKNLFDYLRRTKSSLVLPRLVREETVAKYKHMLEVQARKAAQAVHNLNRLIIDAKSQIGFHSPNSKYQIRDLRKKFRAPATGVSVLYYPETKALDVSDVFLRGIRRRRPANSEGEELRDVILWLIVLQYAQKERKEVAFVTSDQGFWDGEGMHEHIRQDIEQRGVTVSLFRTIEDFVKTSAPAPLPIDANRVSTFFDISSMSNAIVNAMRKALATTRWRFWDSVQAAQLLEAKLAQGTLYEINADTQYAEIAYTILLIAN